MKKSDLEINPKTIAESPTAFIEDHFDIEKIKARLYDLYPLGLVPRADIGRATGGILSARTMSNLDTRGEGIEIKLNVGKKRCYTVDSIIDFVAAKVRVAA